MKSKIGCLTWMACGLLAGALASLGRDAVPTSATTAPSQADLKYGLYIHFGITTYAHAGEQGQIPAERFAPADPDVKAWAHAAKEAGMTFAVLTAKHESGFLLWDSPSYDYDVAQSPFRGDIIGNFIAACNAEGIVPGLHYSIPDGHNDGPVRHKGPVPAVYFDLVKKHVTELLTRYPGVRLLALDTIGRLSLEQFTEVSQLVKRLNPKCVLLNDSGQEDRGLQDDGATVIKGWFWNPNAQLLPAGKLFDQYNRAQAAGRVFILNVGPDTSGRIPGNQMAVLMQMKQLIANPPAATPANTSNPPNH